ncbi:MAG: DUF1573 domain-containing protein [Ignavibacteria bacterium]|nr:DUF1573 domain-containing protein [Ignavibacteria bacterium]
MKPSNGIFLIAVFAALTLSAFAQAPTTPAPEANKCFEVVGTADYYFGSIDGDTPVNHTFIFKNNCKDVIEIDQARASCGCTAAVISEKVIPPGGEAKVEVKFTPVKGSRGKVQKTVSVYLKGNAEVHTMLRFSADVKSELDIQPQYIQLLGAEVGTSISGKASVKNMTTEDLEIIELPFTATSYADTSKAGGQSTVSIPLNKAKVSPSAFTLKPGESKEVTVTVTPEYKGQLNGQLRIKTKKSEAFLQVFGIVRGKGEADPSAPAPDQTIESHTIQKVQGK